MELTKNDVFEIGVENAEVAVTAAGIAWREEKRDLISRGAVQCEECGNLTLIPVWVVRRYLCRDCANAFNPQRR